MSRPFARRLRTAWLAAACAAALAGPASAQTADLEKAKTAQALYDQAVTAMGKKDFDSACPKLEEVVRLEPAGIGAKLTLAECYEGMGRLASAWTTWGLAEAAAAQANQGERQKKAHDRAEALKPRLAQLTVTVPDAVRSLKDLSIQRDGVPVGPAQWGVPLPADKGEHTLVATADGKERWQKVITMADGAATTVEIGPLADAAAKPPPKTPDKAPSRAQLYAGIGVGVAGLAALGVGAAFGAVAIGRKNDSAPHCPVGNQCDDVGFQLRTEGRTDGDVSTALIIAGGVLVAGGVTLVLTAPRAPKVEVSIAPRGAVIRGAF